MAAGRQAALPAFLDVLPPRLADGPAAPCLVSYCGLLAEGETPFCLSHGARWRRAGKPDPGEFTAACDDHLPGCERLDFRRLSGQLRLEAQYAVQRRRDEARLRTPPRHVSQFIGALARSGVSSVLDWAEQDWRTFPPLTGSSASQARALAIQARREAENLCYGTGWDVEYPRSTWRLRNLGITAPHAHVYFGGISQDWLRELAKRHARWQLAAGLSSGEVTAGARAVTRLGAFLESAGITSPAAVSREALEGFLASLTVLTVTHRYKVISHISVFLQAVRLHGWEETLPAGAMIFREDYPRKPARLPRALAEHIMAQVENPANLARCTDPAVRLVTVILMRCGLRSGDALKLPREGCIAHDPDGAPYLRGYVNPNWPHGDGGMWPRLRWRGSVAGGFGRVIPRRCRWGRGRSRPGGLRLCGRGTAGRRCESGGCGRASTTSRTCRRRCSAAGRSGSWSILVRSPHAMARGVR